MTEEQKLNLDLDNAIFLKDDGTEMKFKKIYRKNKKGEIKEYIYEDKYNKENQHNRSQKYYEKYKEEINKKIVCEICKSYTSKSNMIKHLKSKKHLNNIRLKDIQENNII